MKLELKIQDARESGLSHALAAWTLSCAVGEMPTADDDSWRDVVDDGGVAVYDDDGNALWWAVPTIEAAIEAGPDAAIGGSTWGLYWEVTADALVIEGARHALDTVLWAAFQAEKPDDSYTKTFRDWKSRKFRGVEPLLYETSEPSWAWYDTQDEHILDIAEAACVAIARAESAGKKAPAKAVKALQRLYNSAETVGWRAVTNVEEYVLLAARQDWRWPTAANAAEIAAGVAAALHQASD